MRSFEIDNGNIPICSREQSRRCFHQMEKLLLPSSSSPHFVVAQNKTPSMKFADFDKIPSGVSLRSGKTSPMQHPAISKGQVENLHLISLSRQGKFREACEFVEQMDQQGVSVSPRTYENLLETCGKTKSLSDVRWVHNRMRRMDGTPSLYLENCVLRAFCACGEFLDALKLFDDMLERNQASWAILISAFAEAGDLEEALCLFSRLLESEGGLSSSIYTSLLKSVVDTSLLDIGMQLHSLAVRSGLSTHVSVSTALSNMYAKCGLLENAKVVFDGSEEKDAVAWTGLMTGYSQAGKARDAVELFVKMVKEGVQLDDLVFSVVLKACIGWGDLKLGEQVHCWIVKLGMESEVSVGTPLLDLYLKFSNFESACQVFERIRNPNDVSWSAMIAGYCQVGKYEKSVEIFGSLRRKDVILNSFVYTSIFQSCSVLADFNIGSQAHADAIKRGLVSELYGNSALITMYSKCGRLQYACQAFESIEKPDTVAWTAIISGYAYHGNASKALTLFEQMRKSGVLPNEVTLIAVLTACTHSGLVEEAKNYLESMKDEYGVDPTIDHYDCLIDAYSRAGLLQEAFDLINSMPFTADSMSWKCLLSGCWIHKNLELGKVAAENLWQLDPDDTAGYVLMFNLYALYGKLEEASQVRSLMTARNLKKELSCSWIMVSGKVHRFIVGDRHHPLTEEIYSKLHKLNDSFKNSSHPVGEVQGDLFEDGDNHITLVERKEQLLDHSERLALSFGLISVPGKSSIVIFKNLRACKDCHDFAKHVSSVTGREIIIRDSCRFHHFHSGNCSCNDYW